LKSLRAKEVGIAFDDFSTGFASLSYLVKYPLSRIKIDRSFLRHIPESKEEQAIVQATISMAHELGLEVIAEGVETPEHVTFLKEQNREEAQGYYYAKPLPPNGFEAFAKTVQYRTIAHQLAALSMTKE
jgi:EAL domain-containing protein (putative c-di-GMP-specific phosphodiesterase class I)